MMVSLIVVPEPNLRRSHCGGLVRAFAISLYDVVVYSHSFLALFSCRCTLYFSLSFLALIFISLVGPHPSVIISSCIVLRSSHFAFSFCVFVIWE